MKTIREIYFAGAIALLAACALIGFFGPSPDRVEAQAAPTYCQGGTPSGNNCSFSPTQLGVNALTEPGTGTSALSSIVDVRSAREATLAYACTMGNVTVNVQTYAEDGSTTLALVLPVSAVAAAANGLLSIGSESNPAVNTGTLSSTAILRLPQRALAFSFTNAGSAGTCTARLSLQY